jgi:hypothetical protein
VPALGAQRHREIRSLLVVRVVEQRSSVVERRSTWRLRCLQQREREDDSQGSIIRAVPTSGRTKSAQRKRQLDRDDRRHRAILQYQASDIRV